MTTGINYQEVVTLPSGGGKACSAVQHSDTDTLTLQVLP